MGECTAQRTLVKSPPELWAEISDAGALARHLGAMGEIRITRLEPETAVDWEADRAAGRVMIEASGWGTKVTLVAEPAEPTLDDAEAAGAQEAIAKPTTTATQEDGTWRPFVAAAPVDKAPAAIEDDPAPPEPEPEPEPVVVVEEPEPVAMVEEEPTPAPVAAIDEPPAPAPARKPGFLARLFGRKTAAPPPVTDVDPDSRAQPRSPMAQEVSVPAVAEEPPPAPPSEPEPAPTPAPTPAPAPPPLAPVPDLPPDDEPEPTPLPVTPPEPGPPAAAEADRPAPALGDDEIAVLLTGALDSLGAAHHRPFSRG